MGSMGSETLGETLIPVINRLQDIFNQVTLDFKLELPQVAVIGSQSSGKSSVLEALVGRDFLPRGPDICTRRPLVLQLVKSSPASLGGMAPEYGEFLHCPGKRFYDDERMRQEILHETERVVGSNKAVSDRPIRLKITSPNVLTMTLVDLPGLAKVPVGDQPGDIEVRIRAMIGDYIRHPTCVILAVSPANADIVNSDALEMARSVDPEGFRTIGVLTKLDIMDRGTDAAAVLRNEVVPLRLGYIGVVNRSQHDINTQRSIAEARAAEAQFFEERIEYAEVAGQCGTAHLARALNTILVDHIRSLLPGLRGRIEEALDRRAAELKVYGELPPGPSSTARGALLLQLLDSYATRYAEMLEGRSEALPVSELAGGARIRHIFQDIYVKGLDSLNPPSELTDDDVRTAIKNSGGVKGSLLIPEAPFELLVRRAIGQLLTPALQCKEFVAAELARIAGQCAPRDVRRFPALQLHLMAAVEEFIAEGAAPAERMIRDIVACELAHINTDHPAFVGGNRAIASVLDRRTAASQGADEEFEDVDSTPLDASHRTRSGASSSAGVAIGAVTHVRQTSRGHQQEHPHSAAAGPRPQGLKGLEPELFTPGELLGSRIVASDSRSDPGAAGSAVSGTWFSGWFGAHPDPASTANGRRLPSDPPLSQPEQTLRVPGLVSDQEEVQVEVTRLLVGSYFDIVRKNLQDGVPKTLMRFLVNHVQRGLQQHLIRTLYREELFEEMMTEREDIAQKRENCTQALKALREAAAALEALPGSLMSRAAAGGGAAAERSVSRSLSGALVAWPSLNLRHTDRGQALSGAARMAAAAMAAAPKTAGGEHQRWQRAGQF